MKKLFLVIVIICLTGCSTTKSTQTTIHNETSQEVVTALGSVVGAVSNQDVDEADLKNLGKQIQKDEETRTAVEAVSGALSGKAVVKYCPEDGKRYSVHMQYCPGTKIPLKILE